MKILKIFFFLFVLSGIIELIILWFNKLEYQYIFKSLLMPLLIIYLFLETKNKRTKLSLFVIIGLIFSFFGDVFLLHKNEDLFFMLGLGSFLICHIFYSYGFAKTNSENHPVKKNVTIWIFAIVLFGILFYSILFPKLDKFWLPVLVYSAVISVMGIFALKRIDKTNLTSFGFVLTGALLFMASDSLIGINKFYHPFEMANFFIMLLYITAQYLIVKGVILDSKKQVE